MFLNQKLTSTWARQRVTRRGVVERSEFKREFKRVLYRGVFLT